MPKNAIVNSIDNRIGLEIANALSKNRMNVYALTYEKSEYSDSLNIIKGSHDSIEYAINDIINGISKGGSDSNNVDILVNTPLYAQVCMLEDISIDEFISQFKANLFTSIRIIKAVLPTMKNNRKGLIVNIGSLAGIVGFPGISAYASSMFALEGLSECLRYELIPYGIYTVIVEPGAVKSDASLVRIGSNYADNTALGNIYKGIMHLIEHGLNVEDVVSTVLRIIESSKPGLRYIVGEHAYMMLDARRRMSEAEFEELIRRDVGL
jgi:NAD(P)-dependent dehydrogenase (short-subunit alcohol dehydrogenase family)